MTRSNSYRVLMIMLGVMVALTVLAVEGVAQSEGYLYGKVHTSKTIYTGAIRWGNEEVFWSDLFNASKSGNDFTKMVPKQEQKEWWEEYDWSFSGIWKSKGSIHQFTCQFGNIKEFTDLDDEGVTIVLKNGAEVRLDGSGYNDIGGSVQVLDDELGIVSIPWAKINRVEFLPTPPLEKVFGLPLYGTVEGSRREKYSGYIVWDNDERLNSDKLDGDTEDGDFSIKFSEVSAIEKQGKGSLVTLRSGRTVFLDNSNDVNSGNRGVLVVDPEIGIIEFSWNAFKRVTFEKPTVAMQSFQQYTTPVALSGKVSMLDGTEVSGRIIYDVDEAYDFEHIEGKENDIEYQVPIRLIKRITPKNFDYSTLELRSGKTLLLGGMRDVSEDNSGVLVFRKGKKDPVHVSWREVNEIIFN